MDKLALEGGAPSFTKPFVERWSRPKELEKELLNDLIDYGTLSEKGTGVTEAFENEFAKYIGCKHCLSFSHGTEALQAAYYACGVGPGDEIITPAVGWVQSYSGALHLGARPILADISKETLLLDPKKVSPSKKCKALNNIHLNGRINDIDALLEIGLPLVDDASHVHGAEWKRKKIGNADHITCFSLQGSNPYGKPVSCGEGGIACTNDTSLYQKMLAYAHMNRSRVDEELQTTPFAPLGKHLLGLKSRPHPVAMALGLISLSSLNSRNEKIKQGHEKLKLILEKFPFLSFPKMAEGATLGGVFGGFYLIYHPEHLTLSCKELVRTLQAEGMPILGPRVGSLEYNEPLLKEGFDLFGEERGPIGKAWCGLEPYKGTTKEDYPVAEEMNTRTVRIPAFIDVESEYYSCFEKALEKVYANKRK